RLPDLVFLRGAKADDVALERLVEEGRPGGEPEYRQLVVLGHRDVLDQRGRPAEERGGEDPVLAQAVGALDGPGRGVGVVVGDEPELAAVDPFLVLVDVVEVELRSLDLEQPELLGWARQRRAGADDDLLRRQSGFGPRSRGDQQGGERYRDPYHEAEYRVR